MRLPERGLRGRRARAALSLLLAAAGSAHAAQWAVSPLVPGSELAPVGLSLFDTLYPAPAGGELSLPYPFSALVEDLARRLGCGTGPAGCIKIVRIPLGRSLQREAAAPNYFHAPRIVLAVTGESAKADYAARDRLYIGYQAQSDLLEVLSYNARAGRFEFQLVENYAAAAQARVRPARRAICVACHQNQGPIFARPQWDETDANPRIAARIAAAGGNADGLPAAAGVDIPNAIQDAARRANLYAAAQKLWREACRTPRCRAALFGAALRYRLSGGRGHADGAGWQHAVLPEFDAYAARSGGLLIPDSDLPDRDPLAPGYSAALPPDQILAGVPAALDPLLPRPAREAWPAAGTALAARVLPVLADMLAARDIAALQGRLRALPDAASASRTYAAACRGKAEGNLIDLQCEAAAGASFKARIDISATTGKLRDLSLGSFALGDADLPAVEVTQRASGRIWHGTPLRAGEEMRLPDGSRIAALEINWPAGAPAPASAQFVVRPEFEPAERALAELAAAPQGPFEAGIYEGGALIAHLLARLDGTRPPPAAPSAPAAAVVRAPPAAPAAAGPGLFYLYCGNCHQTNQPAPPNFLHGGAARVEAMLRQCGPRIHYRLAMARLPARERAKTPMPPELALAAADISASDWASGQALTAMLAQAAKWAAAATGKAPDPATWRSTQYETLPPCTAQEQYKQGERP
ncbi:MAG: hypothetical protein JNM98_00100 [Rhodocyclaceae bacterium]|nr:hypothetical protein [Rhodocyclaceae bacterium]